MVFGDATVIERERKASCFVSFCGAGLGMPFGLLFGNKKGEKGHQNEDENGHKNMTNKGMVLEEEGGGGGRRGLRDQGCVVVEMGQVDPTKTFGADISKTERQGLDHHLFWTWHSISSLLDLAPSSSLRSLWHPLKGASGFYILGV